VKNQEVPTAGLKNDSPVSRFSAASAPSTDQFENIDLTEKAEAVHLPPTERRRTYGSVSEYSFGGKLDLDDEFFKKFQRGLPGPHTPKVANDTTPFANVPLRTMADAEPPKRNSRAYQHLLLCGWLILGLAAAVLILAGVGMGATALYKLQNLDIPPTTAFSSSAHDHSSGVSLFSSMTGTESETSRGVSCW
jgi:hypothetical protein